MAKESDRADMVDAGLVDLSDLVPRNYSIAGLKRNPFPSLAVPEEVPEITVDRENIIRHFKDALASLLTAGGSSVTVLVGDYGSGKSHLLRVFKRSVNSYLVDKTPATLALYVRTPGNTFRDFLFYCIEDMGRDFIQGQMDKVVRRFLASLGGDSKKYIFDRNLREKFDPTSFDMNSFVRNSTFMDVISRIRTEFFPKVKSSDLVSALLLTLHPDYSSTAWRWLIGEELGKAERDQLSVHSNIDSNQLAYDTFLSLLQLLRSIGFGRSVLLVDELEKIVGLSALKKTEYQDYLRRLLDDNPVNLAVFLAIAPVQWEELTRDTTALVRRLAGTSRLLTPFEPESIETLIREYLLRHRLDSYDANRLRAEFKNCDPSIAPFTQESIDAIRLASKGTVSWVIFTCRKALDYLVDYWPKYKEISPALVKAVKTQEGL